MWETDFLAFLENKHSQLQTAGKENRVTPSRAWTSDAALNIAYAESLTGRAWKISEDFKKKKSAWVLYYFLSQQLAFTAA